MPESLAMSAMMRAAVLTHFFEVADALGWNPAQALREVRLSRAVLDNPEQRIASDAAVALLEAAAAATQCETFGLRMAASRQLSHLGVVSLLITHQPTLRAALGTTIQYRHLLNSSLAMQVEDDGEWVLVREEVVSERPSRQATELALGVLFRLCAAVLGLRWRPHSVHLTHLAPADVRLHRQLFHCPLEFGSHFNGIVCRAVDLDAPNPSADPGMARCVRQLLETMPALNGPSMVMEVRKAIYLMLPAGRANSACVAQGLGLGVRTMQRALDAAGTSFSLLLQQVRAELASYYVANPSLELGRVAELLGYGSHAAFTRWFASQFGMAPTPWRQQQASLMPPAAPPTVDTAANHAG